MVMMAIFGVESFWSVNYESYERVAHINYFKLLGGAKAIKEPRRVALSLLFDVYGEEALSLENPTIKSFSKPELRYLSYHLEKRIKCPIKFFSRTTF